MNRLSHILLSGLVLVLLAGLGCEGPQGPQGEGVDQDFEPPVITLLAPQPGDTIVSTSTMLQAEAVDNDSVHYVEFFVDGSSIRGQSDSAIVLEEPYEFDWLLPPDVFPEGTHIITAKAVDYNKNTSWAPSMPVYHLPLYGEKVLMYDDLLKPDDVTLGILSLPSDDGKRYYNVRFTARTEAVLTEIRLEFADPAFVGYAGGVDIDVFVWDSNDRQPGLLLDSLRIPVDSLAPHYESWFIADVSARNIIVEGDFHAGWSPVFERYDDYLAADSALSMYVEQTEVELYDDPSLNRSLYWAPGMAWGTEQERSPFRRDYHIRAKVDYGSGPD